jgi:hypothetical protein
MFVIDTYNLCYEWVELYLPQLIRSTVDNAEAMVATEFHHTIYELEGSLEELAKVENSDLLDKKKATNVTKEATLDLNGNIADELAEYLTNIKDIENPSEYITLYKETVNDSD